ncbi:hypothetical protein [endosymbiont GvMRE of Glomus versiforme]|uniref:hypothetical protein n=1 Tax=endosymbiont GvMRE of Glomus versiforme TaxID=2039283 RepID=UPI0011C384CF|nr:hypothetical protein [endosymbiont GvMRE of Glomus versiforme]
MLRIVWLVHSSFPKGQWIRQNKKVVKLKIAVKKGINWDIQEVVCLFFSHTSTISVMIAKIEAWTDHQVKRRSTWKYGLKDSSLFSVWKKAIEIPNRCNTNVTNIMKERHLDE